MTLDGSAWGASGEYEQEIYLYSMLMVACDADGQHLSPGPTSLESRFFVDDGTWHDAPVLTGQTAFTPLADVKNILVTGGEGFM
jgi:hypothetical protein